MQRTLPGGWPAAPLVRLYQRLGFAICLLARFKTFVIAQAYHSCIVYSDDHGQSWHLGAVGQPGSRESQIVQVNPVQCRLYLICRPSAMALHLRSMSRRETWGPHPDTACLHVVPAAHHAARYALSDNGGASFYATGIDYKFDH